MTSTTQALLQSLVENDPSLSEGERNLLTRLIRGETKPDCERTGTDGPLLLTQKEAANALGISRVTLWRLTREAVFAPVELTPGNFRYRRDEVEAVAREGRKATSAKRVGRPRALSR